MIKYTRKITRFAALLFLFCILFPRIAYGYLDPAIGSYITQVIIAVLVGGLLVARQYFNKIRNLFKKLLSKGKDHTEIEDKR